MVFVTTPAMRLQVESALSGLDIWDAMEIELAAPILLLQIRTEENEAAPRQIRTFLAKARHLKGLQANDIVIDSVDLFSPPHLNGTGTWRLTQVSELWECCEPEASQLAWLFVMEDGTIYSDSSWGTTPDRLKRLVRLFRAGSRRKRSVQTMSPGPRPLRARERR